MEPAVAAATPVLIGSTSLPATHSDVLINLAPDAPADFSSYARICDLVAGDEQSRRHGRVRWRVYRDAGCSPATVDL
jgi:DNA polymerase-3 subunit chi